MKRLFLLLVCACAFCATRAQGYAGAVPAESEAVMLQGFSWGSMSSAAFGRTKWIDLIAQAETISSQFDIVWLPPSGNGGGGGNNAGYYPKMWWQQDSDWGTTARLKELIAALHTGNTLVLADIVVNHHASGSGWGGFPEERFGTFGNFQLTQADICAGDEAFTDSKSDCKGSSVHGAADTGDNDSGCRDLDHTSVNVQNTVKAYLQYMRQTIGFDGFRYDMVKGYSGSYIEMYNQASQPLFSVGEYYDAGLDNLKNYLLATNYSTLVFDFASKYNCFNSAIAVSSYGQLKSTQANKLHRDTTLSRYAVNFVDNHDTFNRGEGNEYADRTSTGKSISTAGAKVLEANAYLLSMPGIPCVFYPHWNAFPAEITAMIQARRLAGVHSESRVVSELTGGPYRYEAVVRGHKGLLMVRLGSGRDKSCPQGYYAVAQGTNYDIYVEEHLTSLESLQENNLPAVRKFMRDGQLFVEKDNHIYTLSGVLVQ